jgi:hypothetical protein
MSHINYSRSRKKEYEVLHLKQKEGKFAVRTAGSHSVADVLALAPAVCGNGNHYDVELIQIKVSVNLVKPSLKYTIEEIPFPANVLRMSFPVKTEKYYAKSRSKQAKAKRKKTVK